MGGWAAEYTPVTIPDPRGNGQTVTVYNVTPQFAGQVNELDRTSTNNRRTYNGVAGYKITYTFTDNGEPGVNDTASITITNAAGTVTVLTVSGKINKGNQQAHK